MHFIINALSVTNTSGRHVLMGHLCQLAKANDGRHQYTILYHAANRTMREDLGPHVRWHECPSGTAHWFHRSAWERFKLPRLITALGGESLFTPAGVAAPTVKIPQVIFCQNPWCLVPGIHTTWGQRTKARLQRYAYRQAIRAADAMVFNSNFMQQAYTRNAGQEPRKSVLAYQGVDEETFETANTRGPAVERKDNQILTVSVMGSHKGLETVCEALALLRDRYQIEATWKVIGAWPDPAYEQKIRHLVSVRRLEPHVEFCGHVPVKDLHRAYAESRVFCLMSQCESFGIPAVEAQCFGTPVVTSNCCALPEIDGPGGLYPQPGNPEQTAEALCKVLTQDATWQALSDKARQNAQRFHWEACSRPLVELFNDLAGK